MPYSVSIESFEGPLDLLLQLVEGEKLSITELSLVQVTEPFVALVREKQHVIPPEELADFLVIAARLIYLKSKALLPDLIDLEIDDGPDLASQLRMYQAFVRAAKQIGEIERQGLECFSRASRPVMRAEVGFVTPLNVTAETLRALYERVVQRLEPLAQLTKAGVARVVTLEEKIHDLSKRMRRVVSMSFRRYLAEAKDRHEMVVAFLALLELLKQNIVTAKQQYLFDEIHLEKS